MTNFTVPGLRAFIERLLVERPVLELGPPLGLVILRLFWVFDGEPETQQSIFELVEMPNVKRSLIEVLGRHYAATCFARGNVRLRKSSVFENTQGYQTQDNAVIPRCLLELLLDEFETQLLCAPNANERWVARTSRDLARLPVEPAFNLCLRRAEET